MLPNLLALALAAPALAGDPVPEDLRANDFTRSTQDAVTLAAGPDGRAVIAWQSRRQQEGTYAVLARLVGPDGAPLSGEVTLNATTASHQMQPAVALDADGCAWFAWRSFGQDGSLGTIVARRFDPALAGATPEAIVNDRPAGHQTDPAIAALPGGGALVAWLDPGEGEALALRARLLGPDGAPLGDAIALGARDRDHRTPALAAAPDGAVHVVYALVDEAGLPDGVWHRVWRDGDLGEARRLDVAGGAGAVEPAVAADARGALVGWLEREGGGYAPRVRAWRDGAHGAVRELPAGEQGWLSGLALALDGAGGGLAVWNRHADGPKRAAGVLALRLDAATGAPRGEAFRATAASEGPQAIAVAVPGARCALDAGGRALVAWSGDGGLGDGSGAHLSILGERPADAPAIAAAGAPGLEPAGFADPAEGAARPTHDPPTFDPRRIDRDRSEQEGPAAGGGVFDFLGFTDTGWNPPDPEMGVGPDHVVVMVNGGIAWFLKDGTLQFQQDINGAGGFWGAQGASGFVFDPEVVFDVHSQRFFAFASDANKGFLLAVSDDADPNGSWNKYLIDTIPFFGTAFVDSGNLAVDDEFVTITGDLFSSDRLAMLFIDKASAIAGGPLVTTDTIIQGRQSMGTCTNLDPGTQPLFLTWAQEFTTATSIRIYAVTDRATSPQVQFTTLAVPTYGHPNDPPQQGTSSRPELFEARFWSSMVVGGRLWAVHHEGDPARVQWYEIDLGSWPTSGSPSLVQSGEVTPGGDVFTFFPSIWADAAGNAAITYNRSASDEWISIRMVCRTAADPPGTMSAPVVVRNSANSDSSGRFGDYSATVHDPTSPGSFWGHHEYRAPAAWRTRISRIDTCAGSVTSYCTTSPNSAGPGALMATTGTTSIAADDLVLHAHAAPPGQFGLFFFGDQTKSSALGDGTLCVGGSLRRFPVVTVNGGGTAIFDPDFQNLPGGVTLAPGDVQHFQFWFRDPGFGAFGFNLSDAIEVVFCE